MATVAEYEVGYLAKAIPEGLVSRKHTIVEDIYFPASSRHPHLRIRRTDDKYELTKKTQIDPNDAGQQREENVILTAEEYDGLSKGAGKVVSKVRYYMPYEGRTAEVDIFKGELEGLIVVEVEFDTVAEKAAFAMPPFCLVDVTQEEGIAGGLLAGKAYADIQDMLNGYGYTPLHFSV
jgi:CYTH domain-containing protein